MDRWTDSRKERKIQELNKEFLDKLEKTLLKNHYDELNGLSFNIILKAIGVS